MKQFSESYKKELISKAVDFLVGTDEYQCVLDKDLELIKSHYYHAWNNISKKHLNAVVEAIENDFEREFTEIDYLWDGLREAIDSVLIDILDYSYDCDNIWVKKVTTPENYYIHLLKCAVENKISSSIEETIEGDNSFLVIHVNYAEDYQEYKPVFICYTDILDDSCKNNKIVTDILTDSESGFSDGLIVYKNKGKDNNLYNDEITYLIMQLIEKNGFDYILSKNIIEEPKEQQIVDKESKNLKDLLSKLNIEIVTAINHINNTEIAEENMNNAYSSLTEIVDMLGIEL